MVTLAKYAKEPPEKGRKGRKKVVKAEVFFPSFLPFQADSSARTLFQPLHCQLAKGDFMQHQGIQINKSGKDYFFSTSAIYNLRKL